MSAHLRLAVLMARPAVVLLLSLYTAIGLAQSGRAQHHLLTGVCLVAVIGYLVFSLVLNDLADVQVDALNLPGDRRRPLVGGTHRRDLLVVGATAGGLALATAATLGWIVLVLVAAGMALAAAYSLPPLRVAARGALASMLLPACCVAVPFGVGLLARGGSLREQDLALAAGLYLGFIGRIVLKDFRDVRGDALFGKRTFLVRHGRRATCWVSAACWAAGAVLLMAAVPDRTVALGAGYAAGLLAVLGLLWRLARDTHPRRESLLIGAIAVIGRGLAVTLLAHLSMRSLPWAGWAQATVLAALAILTAGLARDLLRQQVREGNRVGELATDLPAGTR